VIATRPLDGPQAGWAKSLTAWATKLVWRPFGTQVPWPCRGRAVPPCPRDPPPYPLSCFKQAPLVLYQHRHHAPPMMKAGLQYSFSPTCVSTHTRLSAIRSSITAWARGRSHPRFSCSMLIVT